MNKRFLEAMAGALAGGTYGVVNAIASEPSVRKKRKEMVRKGVIGAVIGGVATPTLNTLLLKNMDKLRAGSPTVFTGVVPANPQNYFMGGLRALKQGLEKKADYVYAKKPYAAPALAKEIQNQLRSDSMTDEEVQSIVSDFSERVGDPGNVVINRGKRIYGGKYVDYKGKSKGFKGLDLKPGPNVVSEPLRTLLVNTMAHSVDPDRDSTIQKVKTLGKVRDALVGTGLVALLAKPLATGGAVGYGTLMKIRQKPVPPIVPKIVAAVSNPKVNIARKVIRGLLAGGALAAHVARSHEMYKANQRANEVVKNYYNMTDEQIENDPVLYNKLKNHYKSRNMKVLNFANKQFGEHLDILPEIKE